jgi:hypothetical protein
MDLITNLPQGSSYAIRDTQYELIIKNNRNDHIIVDYIINKFPIMNTEDVTPNQRQWYIDQLEFVTHIQQGWDATIEVWKKITMRQGAEITIPFYTVESVDGKLLCHRTSLNVLENDVIP